MDNPVPIWRRLAMEPLAFALLFAFSTSENVTTDLMIYQTCRTTAGFNTTVCNILHENSSSKEAMNIEKLVQPHTSSILILKSCIETIFPTIMSLFLGPWSDKYGRKPLLIFPFIGFTISYGVLMILSTLDVNPYWFVLTSVPSSLVGGFPVILLTLFCYISDITNRENRAWHLACIDTMFFAGILAGLFVGPFVFKHWGYTTVFSVSVGLCLFAVLYSIFCVKETVHNENERTLNSIFDFSLVKELFSAVTKKREGLDRGLVWSCISIIALHVIIMEGNSAVSYLFTSSKLGWNITDYSYYSGTTITISIIAMLLVIKFVGSILKLPDTVIIILSSISNSAGYVTKAFVWKPWHMYLSSGIGMFSASAIPVVRAIISKSVPQKDVGKTFSLTTITEMIVPFATSPLYIYVYMHSLNLYPCPVWFLSATLPVVMIVLAIIIERRWRRLKNTQYTSFAEDSNE